jgi:hypothetical protein
MSWWEAFVWGDLDRRCPARPADRGLLLLDSLLHGGHLVCARKPPREGLAALAARNKAHCQYTVKFWRQRVVIRHRPQRSSRPCGRRPPAKAQKRRRYQRRSGALYRWNRPTSTGARGSDPLWLCWRGKPCLAIRWRGYAASKRSQLERQLILLAHFFAFSPSSARRRRSRSRNGRRRRRRLMAWIHPCNLIAISP